VVSVNKLAQELAEKLIRRKDYYRVEVEKLPSGAKVIDTGLEAHGGYEAGLMVTRIAMGGAGTARLQYADYGGVKLPAVVVSTDYPAIALFGAQLAGWKIKPEGYSADSSGPARALSLKPKEVFQKIEYKDEADVAVILLETEEKPPDAAAHYIAERCGVKPENVYMVLTSTRSVAHQVRGRHGPDIGKDRRDGPLQARRAGPGPQEGAVWGGDRPGHARPQGPWEGHG